jgi:hypothetical protein
MSGRGKEAAQRLLAIIIIIAMMMTMGIPAPVIIFFAVVVYFVWRAVQRSEQQETGRIFEFYIAANEILRDEERRWYGFEVSEITGRGERIIAEMRDAPPLVRFALGALYMRVGDMAAANEHLTHVVESETGDESRMFSSSPELLRYVRILRRLEREPAEAPQTMAAIRNLERSRRLRAGDMLAQSRARLSNPAASLDRTRETNQRESSENAIDELLTAHASTTASNSKDKEQTMVTPPPPITDVLRDLYEK